MTIPNVLASRYASEEMRGVWSAENKIIAERQLWLAVLAGQRDLGVEFGGDDPAAVIKAWKKGDRDLMDAVYSAIPASLVGREQQIDVGPMSGKSNVVFWLEQHGIPCTDPIVDRVFARAKSSTTVLTEEEILAEVYR